MGGVGDSYDNALAETINGLYIAEVIHRRGPWRSFQSVEFATLEWADGFNNRRLLEPIGNIPPAEARNKCAVSCLPPYSPDFNLIEKAFSKLKSLLRKLAERTVSGLIAVLETCPHLLRPTECENFFQACGYDTT